MPDDSLEVRFARVETRQATHEERCDEERQRIGKDIADIKDYQVRNEGKQDQARTRIHKRIDEVGDAIKDINAALVLAVQKSESALSKAISQNRIWALTNVLVLALAALGFFAQAYFNGLGNAAMRAAGGAP